MRPWGCRGGAAKVGATMTIFRYEAIDKAGNVIRGAMNASDERQVAQRLAARGYSARAIYTSSGTAAAQVRRPQATSASTPASSAQTRGGMRSVTLGSGLPVSIKSSVPLSALASFFRHLATLVKSGYPIGQALYEMQTVTGDRRLRKVLPAMREATQSGRSLSSLMAEHPGIFPVHAVASVWCGEMSGRLEIAIEEVAQELEEEASDVRRGRIGWGLMKIALVLFVVLVPMADMVELLMPTFNEALRRGGEMTRSEVIAYVAQTFVGQMFWKSLLVIAALIVCWIVWGRLKRVPAVRHALDEVLLHVPLWGKIHRERALARFFHVLNGLTAAGVGPASAWSAAALTVRNSAVAERLRSAASRLPPDAGIAQLLGASGVFDDEDVAAAASGERAGRIPEVLSARAAAYADGAAAGKSVGRLTSGTILSTTLLILHGYVLYRLITSYFDLAFKAAEVIGR